MSYIHWESILVSRPINKTYLVTEHLTNISLLHDFSSPVAIQHGVLHDDRYSSQDEWEEKVYMNVVSSTMQFPARRNITKVFFEFFFFAIKSSNKHNLHHQETTAKLKTNWFHELFTYYSYYLTYLFETFNLLCVCICQGWMSHGAPAAMRNSNAWF